MALLNRPLTEIEVRQMVADWRKGWPAIPSLWDAIADAVKEPRTHAVHYWCDGRIKYVSPDEFWIGPEGDSVLHVREPQK